MVLSSSGWTNELARFIWLWLSKTYNPDVPPGSSEKSFCRFSCSRVGWGRLGELLLGLGKIVCPFSD